MIFKEEFVAVYYDVMYEDGLCPFWIKFKHESMPIVKYTINQICHSLPI